MATTVRVRTASRTAAFPYCECNDDGATNLRSAERPGVGDGGPVTYASNNTAFTSLPFQIDSLANGFQRFATCRIDSTCDRRHQGDDSVWMFVVTHQRTMTRNDDSGTKITNLGERRAPLLHA